MRFGKKPEKVKNELTNEEKLSILKKTKARISALKAQGIDDREILKTLKKENEIGVLAR